MCWLKTWMPWSVVVGGIYNPNHQSGRWGGCLSTGASDSPVRQPRHPIVRVRPLELWHVGPPDSPVVHRTGTVHCPVHLLAPALTLRAQSTYCSVVSRPLNLTVALATVAPLGTPDSPVLHRTVRWIIAEWLPRNPKVASSEWISLVHRTLSGGTPDSPVRQTRATFGCLLLLSFWTISFNFVLVYCEPLALVEHIISSKLVSPIIYVGQFNHQN
jgi:hypothetical protein